MPFDNSYMISYLSSIVTMSLSYTVSEILSLISEHMRWVLHLNLTDLNATAHVFRGDNWAIRPILIFAVLELWFRSRSYLHLVVNWEVFTINCNTIVVCDAMLNFSGSRDIIQLQQLVLHTTKRELLWMLSKSILFVFFFYRRLN